MNELSKLKINHLTLHLIEDKVSEAELVILVVFTRIVSDTPGEGCDWLKRIIILSSI